MNKAIEIKQKLLLNANRAKMVNVDTAMQIFVAELTAHRAKIDSLREYCREQVDNINKIGDLDIIDVMKRTIYRDMLNKLEEEGKAQ